ncbi:unnamed protein product [Gadus morhua 'NCC']
MAPAPASLSKLGGRAGQSSQMNEPATSIKTFHNQRPRRLALSQARADDPGGSLRSLRLVLPHIDLFTDLGTLVQRVNGLYSLCPPIDEPLHDRRPTRTSNEWHLRRDEALPGKADNHYCALDPALVFCVACRAHVPAEECQLLLCHEFSVCQESEVGEIEADGRKREVKARGTGERDRGVGLVRFTRILER